MALRIVLRVLIAVGLLLQGGAGIGAGVASGVAGHHCHSSSAHDGDAPKCPCCPAKSIGMSCADACMTVAALPASLPLFASSLARISPDSQAQRPLAAALDTPLRPPIS